jgi:putative membrane protein
MKLPFAKFLLRWFVCGLGLWIAAGLLSERISYQNDLSVIVTAGLVLAAINTIIRPILVLLSLPAILLSLGLFMVVINGFTVFLASKLYSSLEVTNFWAAMLAGIIIGLVNYLVSAILDTRDD